MPRGRKWTKKEEQALLQGAGVYGLAWLQKKGGASYDWPNAPNMRSAKAVYGKARALYGGGLSRGAYSLHALMVKTGYSKSQLLRAMSACRQKWQRLTPNGSYLIYEEQVDELTDWLAVDYWAVKHRLYNCLWCASDTIPHRSQGLCNRCYWIYAKRLNANGLTARAKALLVLARKRYKVAPTEFLEKAIEQLSKGRAVRDYAVDQLIRELGYDQ